ncbi:hypothetical protein GCM10022280_18140 [Sphingomonas swuensis]|uniref:Uncharacterized protein n=1 Tax=Sphingomonas swuensis TaxID=977800 RepID=A0ABP7SZY4_9SPHN
MNDQQYLLFRWRQETLRAEVARCPHASSAHKKLAELFRGRLVDARTDGLEAGPVSSAAKAVVAEWALKH